MTVREAARHEGGVLDESAIDYDAIVTEDDTPVDNLYSERNQRLLTEPLDSQWSGAPQPGDAPVPFLAMSNVGVFTAPHEPPMVPDVALSVGVSVRPDLSIKKHRSYFVWLLGKVPDVIIEIVSNREGGELSTRKKRYAQMGVPFYVVWDPYRMLGKTTLRAFKLAGASYRTMARPRFVSLGLTLVVWNGSYKGNEERWLRWADLDGTLIATPDEAAEVERQRAAAAAEARSAAEQQRAEAERLRAEAEQQRAIAEQQRAEAEDRATQLAARLRALGVDPDGA